MARHYVVGFGLLLVLLAVAGHAQERIAFMRIDGDQDICYVNPDGTGLVPRVVNNPANDVQPSWSPDDTQVAFASTRDGNTEIYRMNANGSGQTRLTFNGAVDQQPSWSPDGTRLVFVSNRTGNYEVYSIPAVGGPTTQLTFTGADNFNPAWSPDGSRILLSSTRNGNRDLVTILPDGTGMVPLTSSPQSDDDPHWSADGTRIVWARWVGGQRDIWVMNADGSGQHVVEGSNWDDFAPDWSPDASRIVFSRTLWPYLMVMNADGTNQVQITSGHYDIYPHWSRGLPTNRPPIAAAGADRTVEADAPGGANVTLDGSGSSDPDGDALLYTWTEGTTALAGPSPSPTADVFLTLGSHEITLLVDDQKGGTATDSATLKVQDTTAPDVSDLAADPSALWPPNGKLRLVTLRYTVSDVADAGPTVAVVSVACNEAAFDSSDYEIIDATHLRLRAKRDGRSLAGRVYTITVQATDATGNVAEEQVTVTVPHDQRVVGLAGLSATPTRAGAEVTFTLSGAADVSATVLNLAGRPVKRLQADRATAAGTHRLVWNAMGDNGLPVPAGRYLIEVTARAADGSVSRALASVTLDR